MDNEYAVIAKFYTRKLIVGTHIQDTNSIVSFRRRN